MPVYQELVERYEPEYIAGGATQNSIRVCQWMLQAPGATSYIGCVGRDAFGEQLRASASSDGVNVLYLEDEEAATGTCACLINGGERSLIANLAAANLYKKEHLMREEVQAVWRRAKICYSAGFFLTVSPESMMEVAAQCNADPEKRFAVNLSAPFIAQFFGEPLNAVLPLADIVIGNESEAQAYAAAAGWGEDLTLVDIAQRLHALPKANQERERLTIVTNGSGDTIVVENGETSLHPVPPVPKEEIVDVNGAGDAFVGGLLSQLVQGKSSATAVAAGHYAASVIIRVGGTVLSGTPNFSC